MQDSDCEQYCIAIREDEFPSEISHSLIYCWLNYFFVLDVAFYPHMKREEDGSCRSPSQRASQRVCVVQSYNFSGNPERWLPSEPSQTTSGATGPSCIFWVLQFPQKLTLWVFSFLCKFPHDLLLHVTILKKESFLVFSLPRVGSASDSDLEYW